MRPAAFFISCTGIVILLFLSILNISNFSQKPKVLGIASSPTLEYWRGLVDKNPTYFDGWLELYNLTGDPFYLNKAKEIKPNYF